MAAASITAFWESLFLLYLTIGATVAALTIGVLVAFAAIFRTKEGRPEPEDAPRPGHVPRERGNAAAAVLLALMVAGILFTITLGTMSTASAMLHPPQAAPHAPPGAALVVNVTGFQWGWKFTYPNGKEAYGEAVVPRGAVVIFRVTSVDVLHKFQLVDFRVGVDAVPGRFTTLWIQPEVDGNYTIRCFELCGVGHAEMVARLVVVEPAQFAVWYGGTT